MAEVFHWHGQSITEEDDFLETLVAEMNTAGPNGARVSELLDAVKSANPDWYQLGVSARGLRSAFAASPPSRESIAAARPAPSPAAIPAPRWPLRAVAGGVAALALLLTVTVVIYGYATRPAATDYTSVPPPTSVTLTQEQMDAIAKAARGPVSQDVVALGQEVEQLKDRLAKAAAESEQGEKALADRTAQLKAMTSRATEWETQLRLVKQENARFESVAKVFGEKHRLIIGEDKGKEFVVTTNPFTTDSGKDEMTTCITVPKSLKTPFVVVPKDGKLELLKFESKEKDPFGWLKDDRMLRPAVVDK